METNCPVSNAELLAEFLDPVSHVLDHLRKSDYEQLTDLLFRSPRLRRQYETTTFLAKDESGIILTLRNIQ